MKTVLAKFDSIDRADLASKELKEKGLIQSNIEINYEESRTNTDNTNDYVVFPMFSSDYSASHVFPFFSGIIPYQDNGPVNKDIDSMDVLFCAKCEEENLSVVQSILRNHLGYDIKIM